MPVAAALRALGTARATYYNRRRTTPRRGRGLPRPPRRREPRALDDKERQAILDALHSERFIDLSPREAYATLLDEGVYLGSVSTFYRILRSQGEVRERRRLATHPPKVKPD